MKKEKLYGPNTKLYLSLLIAASVVIFVSFFMDLSSRYFTITAGLGCGGVTSVVVAWLIDAASCRKRKRQNEDFLEHIFDRFDMLVKIVLQLIIVDCARRDDNINIENKYSIAEIEKMLNSADGSFQFWDDRYLELNRACASVDIVSLLTFDSTPQHTELYTIINTCVCNGNAFKAIQRCNMIKDNTNTSVSYSLLCSDIILIKDVYSIRNLKVEFEMDLQSKEYIRKWRNVKK